MLLHTLRRSFMGNGNREYKSDVFSTILISGKTNRFLKNAKY